MSKQANPVMIGGFVLSSRFDGRLGGDVQLNARWSVLSGDGDTVLISKVSQIRVAIEGSDHGAFAAAQSLAVMRLGSEIAGAVVAQTRQDVPASEVRMMSEHPERADASREAPTMVSPCQDSQRASGAFGALKPSSQKSNLTPAYGPLTSRLSNVKSSNFHFM